MSKFIVFMILIFFNSLVFGKTFQARSVDAYNLDISGVKLGMTTNEATKALMKKYKIGKNKIIRRHLFNQLPHLFLKYKKNKITVYLAPDIFKRNGKEKEVVHQVVYEVSSPHINGDAMKKATLKKYGEISGVTLLMGRDLFWCKNPIKVQGRGRKQNPYTCVSPKVDAYLHLSNTTYRLSLEDKKFHRESLRLQEEKLKSKPIF